jgi:hypothetical protein
MTDEPKYRVEEGSTIQYGKARTTYSIVRTDGTPAGYGPGKDLRIHGEPFFTEDLAKFYAKFYENTPDGFRIEKALPRAGRIDRTTYWVVTGSTKGDPSDLRMRIEADWTAEGKNTPAGTTVVDILIQWANQHAAGAEQRIAEKAEKDAIAAAEATVREAREEQLAEARRTKGELATARQVDYILQLLTVRARTGEGGGFFQGPTDRAGIEELSKAEASTYITSLKGDY